MYNRLTKIVCVITIISLVGLSKLKAQNNNDTIRMSLKDVEKRFLDSNLLLLASHYNVDANKALIEQAKLWDNPVLVTDQNIYSNNRFFEHGKDANTEQPLGQYFIQIQQLIKTAGKRGKLINLSTTNAKLAEWQLSDVLRNLKYQLRQSYYNLCQELEVKKLSESQLVQMNKLLFAQEAQLKAGNIAEKDFLRIKAIVLALEQDITDINKNLIDINADLKNLLQLKANIFIKPIDNLQKEIGNLASIKELIDTAFQVNPYYQLQKTQVQYQQQNLIYQKTLRTPDITIGTEYDHNSNYTPKYVGLSISIPLPIFNKNQGNIKSASFAVKQQQALTQNSETELYNNVLNAFDKLKLTIQQCNALQKEFYSKYKNMFQNMLLSYQQKQLNLLEFLDFYNAYSDAQQRQIQQQLNLQLAKEELNYQIGSDIIK